MMAIWNPTIDTQDVHWVELAERLAEDEFAPKAESLDRDQRYPDESVELLVESGLAGMFIQREYGGGGASFAATCAVIEIISRACASTGAIITAYALGGKPILIAGTEEQKVQYLSAATKGNAVSFALTEVGAGSDAGAIRTTAVEESDGFRIKGEKIYIGNGGASAAYVVFARTDPDAGVRGITAFMVERDAEGVVIDRYEDKMGLRGTKTSNIKLDTHVHASAMLGERGRGLRLALSTLDSGRITVAAQSTGVALAAYHAAGREAVRRTTFGTPLIENQGISFPLADVATELSAARLLTFAAADAHDEGRSVTSLGAMAKLYASEVAHRAADLAVQVHGGDGYCKPNIAERLYRDQRILEIYEGASEIQRIVIGRAVAKEMSE
jgi:alkylation response protein AidB-like acyl-CoA dehydrogenase